MTTQMTVDAVMDLAGNLVVENVTDAQAAFTNPLDRRDGQARRQAYIALRAAVELLEQQARAQALRDAAQVCEDGVKTRVHSPPMFVDCVAVAAAPSPELAAAIRAMIPPESPANT